LPKITEQSTWWLRNLADFLRDFGHTGVDLFFVLSGFLVSGLLFAEFKLTQSVNIRRFLIRRALKLYPAFYFFLLFSILFRIGLGDQIGTANIIAEVLFVQNYFNGVWSHTWSLAVEEHFYLLLALGIAALIKSPFSSRPLSFVPIMYVVMLCLVLTFRYQVFHSGTFTFRTHRCPTHLQIDSLMFGVVLSYAVHFWKSTIEVVRRFKSLILLASMVSLVGSQLLGGVWGYTLGHPLLYFGFGGFVIVAATCTWSSSFFLTGLGFVGAHSYSIYLWHTVVLVMGRIALQKLPAVGIVGFSWEVKAIVYIIATIVVGVVLSKVIEIPILNIRDTLFPSLLKSPEKLSGGKDDQ
jgi:peptidoglycan/LPS O-acetylase OafA/YrhL